MPCKVKDFAFWHSRNSRPDDIIINIATNNEGSLKIKIKVLSAFKKKMINCDCTLMETRWFIF